MMKPHNPDYQLFKSDNHPEEMEELKLDKETCLEDENIGTWHLGKQEYQVFLDSLLRRKGNRGENRNLVKFNGNMTKDDSIDGRERTTLYAKTPLELQWREDRTGLCNDASVMDCEMPERVVFPQESNCQVVKDICIDREIPSQNKCSIENCELDHNVISCLLNSDMDTSSKSTKEALNAAVSISNASESFSDHDCIKDVLENCSSTNFSMEPKGDFDASIDIADGDSTKKTITGHRGEQKDHKIPSMGAILASSSVSSATEAASKTEVETRTITTYGCGSLVTTISGGEESPGNADCQPPLETVNMFGDEDGMSESLRISREAYDHGESSFSAVSHFSGPIVHSGPMSYSGSISLRSNSSNNSMRSFVFPVLSSEWNGSPVRMMEADRRHLKKHRRWMTGFLCCKF